MVRHSKLAVRNGTCTEGCRIEWGLEETVRLATEGSAGGPCHDLLRVQNTVRCLYCDEPWIPDSPFCRLTLQIRSGQAAKG